MAGEANTVELREFIFTFGLDHIHPLTGESLMGRFIAIRAPDHETARAMMVGRFGTRWAFQYPSREAAKIEKYKMREWSREDPL